MKGRKRVSALDLQLLESYRFNGSLQQQQVNAAINQPFGVTTPANNPNDVEQVARIDNDPDFYYALPYVVNPDQTYQRLGISQLIPIYENLAQDAHISGIIQRMYAGLIRFEYHVQPGGNRKIDKLAAALCERVLEQSPSVNFSWPELFFKMYEAVLYGFDLKEIVWDYQGKYLIPVELIDVPRRRILFSPYGLPLVRTRTNFIGEPLHQNNYLLTRHRHTVDNPYGQAALSSCYKLIKYKEAIIDFYVKFLEKYGSPLIVGKYPPGTTDTEIDTIVNHLNELRESACSAVPDNVLIELIESKSNSDKMAFNGFIEMVNSELSKAILSATLGVEIQDSGSRAAAATHLESEQMVTEAHRKMVASTINRLFKLVAQFNFGENVKTPYFEFFEESDTKKTMAESFDILRKYLPISLPFASDRLQVEIASEGEAILPGYEGDWGIKADVDPTEPVNTTVQPEARHEPADVSPIVASKELPKEEQQIEDGLDLPDNTNENELETHRAIAFSAFPGYDNEQHLLTDECTCDKCNSHHDFSAKNWVDTLDDDDPIDIIKRRSAIEYSKFLNRDLKAIGEIVNKAESIEELQRKLFDYYQAPRDKATKNLAEATTLAFLLGYQKEVDHATLTDNEDR